jgi:lipid-binding SYLF domain-containing protein
MHQKSFAVLAVFVLLASAVAFGFNRADSVKRLQKSSEVFGEIMRTPDKGIPEDLLDKCACIGIVPGLKKGGLGIGGKYGRGVLMCRKPSGWTAPSFITIEGGSVGFQIGFTQIDVVMLFMNKKGVEKLIDDKFTIGADASAAAGPVGRSTAAQTNIRLDAEILTYSRAKGLFAGVALDGATLRQDKDDNKDFYGAEVDARKILIDGTVPMPTEAQSLASALSSKSPKKTP